MDNNFDRNQFYALMAKRFRGSATLVKVISIISILVFGLGLAAIFVSGDEINKDVMAAIIICLVFIVLGIWGYLYGRKLANPERNPVLQDIRTGGDRIVWFYNSNTTVNGIQNYAVEFMNRTGNKRKIPAKNADMQEEILYSLSQLYPNAVIGYSPEIAKEMKRLYRG